MPKRSSSTAPVTFLDATGVVEQLRSAAQRLCAGNDDVVAVVLFGSLASGSATPGSDADLVVLLRSDARRMLDRIPEYTRPFEVPGVGVQVLPWTRAELNHRLASHDRFAREVIETGVVLAGTLP